MHEQNARRVVGMVLGAGRTALLPDAQLLQQFVNERSAEAFTEIVRRHGSMVMGVCRRVLRHEQDAEDSFQAVFVVLARKASGIRPPDGLGRWLYGVAFRTAQKAKTLRYREEMRRSEWVSTTSPEAELPAEPLDWLPLLDHEINRLSERHRMPIVLCDLLGRSRREAAIELGISEGTLSSRLSRARDTLRRRLARRGIIPSITAFALAKHAAAVSVAAIESTYSRIIGAGSATVNHLVEGVIRSMSIHALMKPLALLSCLTVIAGMGFWFGSPSGAEPLPSKTPSASTTRTNEEPAAKSNEKKHSTDEELFQGTWLVKEAFSGGVRDKHWIGREVTFRKDYFNYLGMFFTLDPTQSPKVCDFAFITEGVSGQKRDGGKGIYELQGDSLRLCWNMDPKTDRPKTFKPMETNYFLVLERVKIDARQERDKSKFGEEKWRVMNLRKELVKTLIGQQEALEAAVKVAGRPAAVERLLEHYRQLLKAELELASEKKDRIAALQRNLEKLETLEHWVENLFNFGTATRQDVLGLTAARLQVEILLETEKQK